MPDSDKPGMLLGKHTPVIEEYSPQLLYPILRSEARQRLGLTDTLPFAGCDVWHAYELSWLDSNAKPVVWVGRLAIPADSPAIVESKSFKLYLNSLNNTCFPDTETARNTIVRDVGGVVGAQVTLELFEVDDRELAGAQLPGICLDDMSVSPGATLPDSAILSVQQISGEERLYSHLLRSLCPVTGQPDWATVWIHYRGTLIERESLLQYIIAYREHQEFHEQCVERIFNDIYCRFAPELLHIQGFYTRRGGLDITPFRSSDPAARPLPRLNRQ